MNLALALGLACAAAGVVAAAPAVLAPATEPVVVNAGKGGHNTRDLLARLERDVLAQAPDLVVLMVGTNDALNHQKAVPLAEYEANLRALVERLTTAGCRVLLLTIPPCHDAYVLQRHPPGFFGPDGPTGAVAKASGAVRRVAAALRLPLVDVHTLFAAVGEVGTGARSLLRNEANSRAADGVHPTPDGYRAIAAAVYQAILDHDLPRRRVVCFGDSITFGAGVEGAGTATGQTYPALLARLLEASFPAE